VPLSHQELLLDPVSDVLGARRRWPLGDGGSRTEQSPARGKGRQAGGVSLETVCVSARADLSRELSLWLDTSPETNYLPWRGVRVDVA
jgi:hypothetical protein